MIQPARGVPLAAESHEEGRVRCSALPFLRP